MAKKGIHRSLETEFKKGMSPRGKPFQKGQIAWNKGLKGVQCPTAEQKEKARQSHIGKRYNDGQHWITKTCQKCEKEFEVRRGAGKRRIYCSRRCGELDRKSNGFVSQQGYKIIRHNGRAVFEHRFLTEQEIGRPLKKGELVHHINSNKLDNRKENRIVMSQASHWGLVHYLANLWIQEHLDIVGKITRDFEISFTAGG